MINNNVEIIEMTDSNGNPKLVAKITNGEDSYTWMDKSVYDAQQEHLTENPTEDVE